MGTIKAPPPQARNDELASSHIKLGMPVVADARWQFWQQLYSALSVLIQDFTFFWVKCCTFGVWVTVSNGCVGEHYSLEICQQMYSAQLIAKF